MPSPQAVPGALFSLAIVAICLCPLPGHTDDFSRKPSPSPALGITLRPSGLSFGQISVGEANTRSLTITNTGNSDVVIPRIECAGDEFTLSGLDLPLILAGGQSFTFMITFNPRSSGVASGTVSAIGGKASVTLLSGEGTTSLPNRTHPASESSLDNRSSAPVQRNWRPIWVGRSVQVSWVASKSRHIVGYNVYRSLKSGGPYTRINHRLDPATTYTDNRIKGGNEYYYVATALDSKGKESHYSKQVRVNVP